MRAILMAGGSGTRLRPLTCDLPKPMVPILNRPIVGHLVNLLRRHGIREIIITLHFLPDAIRNYFGDGSEWGTIFHYVVEEDQPLGTAGSVKNVESLLNETFLVISGDSVTDVNLTEAIKFHRENRSVATLVLRRVDDPMAFGVVITNRQGRILRFLEKPAQSEIFSDTVNTGIYILEPEVLQFLTPHTPADFSQDLFPRLLAEGVPMYGYITDAYWCDVGSLEAYRQAQYDAIRGRVDLQIDYLQPRTGLWVGHNTIIDPTAKIETPAMIGDNTYIGPHVSISAGTIIGNHVTIEAHADLQRPILGNGVFVGEESHLWSCTVGRNVRIGRRSHIMEGAVIGADCTIGEEACILTNVRVWPSKQIEPGASLNHNLIWGAVARRNLFGQRGVSGIANVDITPEFAVKLGAAYGATLKPGNYVMVSRDQRTISRMISRSLISGLMSVGINVHNLEATAIPIARFMAAKLETSGGIHVRIDPDRGDHILIEFFDRTGININKEREKKIESTYFKEDFRRARIEEIGEINYPARVLDYYNSGFAEQLDVEAIRRSTCKKVVIDYVYAVSGAVLPRILGKFGSDVVVLNASLNELGAAPKERERMLGQLQDVVKALQANFGAQVFANGEKFVLVDEAGNGIEGEELTGVMVEMALTAQPGGTVIVPVNVSSMVEAIAQRHQGVVIRTKANSSAVMSAALRTANAVICGCADMGFIFPQLHYGFDAMFSIAKIIEWLTKQKRTIGEVRASLPRFYHRWETVRCPWSIKGTLMRHLVESQNPEFVELVDGVKIFHGDHSWVLILPDAHEPSVHICASSDREGWVESQLKQYQIHVESFCRLQTALSQDTALLEV